MQFDVIFWTVKCSLVSRMEDKEIVKRLLEWYEENKTNQRKWSKTEIGKAIKQIVKTNNNWKETKKWIPKSDNIEKNIKQKEINDLEF